MRDILFRIPLPFVGRALPIHSYGLMAMLGFLAGLFVARRNARYAGVSPESATDFCIAALVGGIIGARAFYVAQFPEQFFGPGVPFWNVLKIWEGGLVFYGGLFGGMVGLLLTTYSKRERPLNVLDLIAPSLCLGLAFGRVGCFLHGCCYGVPLTGHHWYGVVFPPDAPAYQLFHEASRALGLSSPSGVFLGRRIIPPGTPLFPSQIVSSLYLIVIFAILALILRRRRHEGVVAGWALVLYSICRFAVEFGRGDTRLPGELSVAQRISIFVFFAGVLLLVYSSGYGKPVAPAERRGPGSAPPGKGPGHVPSGSRDSVSRTSPGRPRP